MIKEYVKSKPGLYLRYRNVRYQVQRVNNIIKKDIWNVIDRKKDKEKLMVNVGSGIFFRRHWKNLDFPSEWYRFGKGMIDYEYDLTSGEKFPFENDTVYIFYSSHTMEHMQQKYCQHIFNEMFRCLKKGGGIRITNPDFELGYKAYGSKNMDFFKKYIGSTIDEKFLYFFATYYTRATSEKLKKILDEFKENYKTMSKEEFADYYTSKIPSSNQIKHTGDHCNWWTIDKFQCMLKIAGFENIYRSKPQESKFPEMHGFGRHQGFDSTHPELSIFVEAIKGNEGKIDE